MSDIQNVDYEAFPAQAAQIRSYAQELNTELTNAYTNITNMHNVWYGKRYNSLVTSFNNIIPQLNQLLDLVVGEIPYAIETAANNYSNVDEKGNIVSAQNTPSNKIAEIPVINDVGLRFMPADVSDIQNQVSTNLDNSKSKMDSIEEAYNKIVWNSDAGESFRSTFISLKTQIVSAFEDLKSQFTTLMNQAQEDMQSAESANTVG